MKPWRLLPFSTAVALSTLLPSWASAHLVNTDVGEFYAGMLHPLTSPEHLLPTLALALLATSSGVPAATAVDWVRTAYCPLAVETSEQAAFVAGASR